MSACAVQAVNGGSPTYFGIPLPFDLTTLLAIVRPPCLAADVS